MLDCRSYTKAEIAAELQLNTDKTSNITRKLNSMNYTYTTSGRGDKYMINIISLPQETIKSFASKYLSIEARYEDKLMHFLQLLFTTGSDRYANMSARSLEWYSPSYYTTIQKWMEGLIDCGLLVEENLVEVYYATKKNEIDCDENGDIYTYYQEQKEITYEEYSLAVKAYNDIYNKMTRDIDTNPYVVADEAIYVANCERRAALDGWWANRKSCNCKIVINKQWEYYDELMLLLEAQQFEAYQMKKSKSHFKEMEEFDKRVQRWEEEKQAKAKKLNIEIVPQVVEVVKMQPIKKVEEKEEVEVIHKKHKLKDNSDMPVFDNVRDALLHLKEKFGIREGVLNCYEQEDG